LIQNKNMTVSLGIDFGTSGARLVAIDTDRNVLWWGAKDFGADNDWRKILFELIKSIPIAIKSRVARVAIDGTSSTVLLCDADGKIVGAPILYYDDRGKSELAQLRSIAPPGHTVISATSSLAKLYWFAAQPNFSQAKYLLHQADWLAFHLHGKLGWSDYHNALKLGYDVQSLCYPDWLERHPYRPLLPQILPPGTPIGTILPQVARDLGMAADCVVCAGTTDSIAAFLASGATMPGEAVTSLGSTLVIKLLSHTRVDDPQFGIYSHRWGDLWLVGGASNTGGAVLRHYFSDAELVTLSQEINLDRSGDLDYYPLLSPGERFPINDPNLAPRLTPRPDRAVNFLYGMLVGIAKIEARGYQLLAQLGATPLSAIYTAGGGAQNPVWMQIRQQHLPVTVSSQHRNAAYGTALLAQVGLPRLNV
jgi:D-ribulokinase